MITKKCVTEETKTAYETPNKVFSKRKYTENNKTKHVITQNTKISFGAPTPL